MSHQDPNHAHHQDAAKHHDQAASSHREAATLREAGKHDAAAAQSLIAHGHTLHALAHSEAAIKSPGRAPAPIANTEPHAASVPAAGS